MSLGADGVTGQQGHVGRFLVGRGLPPWRR
uniref:Uncharacterized protein n=1 Tax=Arundo donax TaxID=35708 RepID=A0A0A9CCM9_ARUDO